MKPPITSIVLLLSLAFFISISSAEDVEVEPTDKEVEYMEKLDGHMTENFGGTEKVDGGVTESPEGKRTILLDYSESKGMEINSGQ